jgi:thioredoxin-like negative regulator of GroEL
VSIANSASSLAAAQQEAQQDNDTAAENLVSCLESNCASPCGG